VAELSDRGKLPFLPRRVGAFWGWGAGVPQIDVVAINEDEHQVLVGECKWTAAPIRRRVAARFLERARSILPTPAERWQVHYVLFARLGFTREAVEAGENVAARWVSLADIDADLRLT
jgi:hypothetical protein